ncbi:MAG: hypothetical protein Q8L81_18345 [Bacteroidota bacterium]|nr:hypothetical protein [Bacteroidota bacterium]
MIKIMIYRNIWLGFLSWLIPFAISFFCYKPDGQLIMEYSTFKSIMTISGTVSGSYLLYQYFKAVSTHFVFNGIVVGLSWVAINVLLDSIILIPMMKVSFSVYFLSIGLSYVSIPAISMAMGFLLDRKTKPI